MPQLFTNNATTTLSAAVSNSDTVLTVVDGSLFPSPTNGDFAVLTLTQASTETAWEEVKLTSRSGNALTVSRAYEGADAPWLAGDKVELRVTAKYLNSVGYINIPQTIMIANYTLALRDQGFQILHPTSDTTARTVTIPANSAVPFPIGTAITFVNQSGAGVLTIAITTDIMRLAGGTLTGGRTLAANGIATAVKVTTTEWLISGVGIA